MLKPTNISSVSKPQYHEPIKIKVLMLDATDFIT